MRYFRINCTLLTFILASLISSNTIAAQYYMFKDKNGQTLIQDSIPPEYVKNGYKVVNERGVTIEIVPSERERREKLKVTERRQNEINLAEKEKATKQELDERLFQSFSSADDIRLAGNKKITAIQMQINTTVRHIQAFEGNLEQLEAQSSAGGDTNKESMQRLRQSIKQNMAFINRKRDEQNKIRDEYLSYIQRYQLISTQ